MKYAMLICDDPNLWEGMDAETLKAEYDKIYEWIGKWHPTGKILDGGAELQHPRTARTIRAGEGGTVVTDGPYLELKEIIGGVMFLEADSPDEAVEIASGWPGLAFGAAVEVRPVVVH